jgi:hypothetical protein
MRTEFDSSKRQFYANSTDIISSAHRKTRVRLTRKVCMLLFMVSSRIENAFYGDFELTFSNNLSSEPKDRSHHCRQSSICPQKDDSLHDARLVQ